MGWSAWLVILFRWLHLTSGAVVVGGVFYARIVVPIALRGEADANDSGVRAVLLRGRRAFKITVHTCTLFLLLSGTYNAVLNWPAYTRLGPAVGHSLFGLHLLLGLAALGVLLWLMTPRQPRASDLPWMAAVLGLLMVTIATSSTLKYAREAYTRDHAGPAALVPAAAVPAALVPAAAVPAAMVPAAMVPAAMVPAH